MIGSVAEMESAPLMTANDKDFTGYFPDVEFICPDGGEEAGPA